jgi:hypothetical protein
MTNDQIQKFIEPKHLVTHVVKIDFKTRNSINGIFIKGPDYNDLKAKNFWRIVSGPNVEAWQRKGDNNLAKIFNGAEITRLTAITK